MPPPVPARLIRAACSSPLLICTGPAVAKCSPAPLHRTEAAALPAKSPCQYSRGPHPPTPSPSAHLPPSTGQAHTRCLLMGRLVVPKEALVGSRGLDVPLQGALLPRGLRGGKGGCRLGCVPQKAVQVGLPRMLGPGLAVRFLDCLSGPAHTQVTGKPFNSFSLDGSAKNDILSGIYLGATALDGLLAR